jgi:hypothetical protein
LRHNFTGRVRGGDDAIEPGIAALGGKVRVGHALLEVVAQMRHLLNGHIPQPTFAAVC